MMSRRTIGIAGTAAGLLMGLTISLMIAATPAPGNTAPGNTTQDPGHRGGGGPGGMPDLIRHRGHTNALLPIPRINSRAARISNGQMRMPAKPRSRPAVYHAPPAAPVRIIPPTRDRAGTDNP